MDKDVAGSKRPVPKRPAPKRQDLISPAPVIIGIVVMTAAATVVV